MSSCMADETMLTEYPDAPQRYAVCLGQWDAARGINTKPVTDGGFPVSPF